MNTSLFEGYVIDTNTIIDLGRRIYPPEIRASARAVVEELVTRGSIMSPQEVYLEISRKAKNSGDEALAWSNAHRKIFEDVTPGQQLLLAEILGDFPTFVKVDAEDYDADPILVAMAREYGGTVVTQDGAQAPDNVVKVHQVCKHYNVRCLTTHQFLVENGWHT